MEGWKLDFIKDWFPLFAQLGLMIWWMSRINTKIEAIADSQEEQKSALADHIEDDKNMQKQIQSMAVNEANVGGMLSNLALEIRYIRQTIDDRTEDNGEMFELKLQKQSSELIIKFRDMLHVAKQEIVTEAGQSAAHQIRRALEK